MDEENDPYSISRRYWELEFELDPLAPVPAPPDPEHSRRVQKRKVRARAATPRRPTEARQSEDPQPKPRPCYDSIFVELFLARSRLEAWLAPLREF